MFVQIANGVFSRLSKLRPNWKQGDILHVSTMNNEAVEKDIDAETTNSEDTRKSTAEMESVYRLISLLNFISHFVKENLQVCHIQQFSNDSFFFIFFTLEFPSFC